MRSSLLGDHLRIKSCSILISYVSELNRKQSQKESLRITNTAAKLILSDIRSIYLEIDIYPTENKFSDIKTSESLLPESLRRFLEVLIKRRLKKNSVGQAIISVARPRSGMLPITFRLRIKMDNMFGSHWLLDELLKIDFSVFYDENNWKQFRYIKWRFLKCNFNKGTRLHPMGCR